MKVVIVGGVAGGASTAARLRRLDEHADITIYERSGYISYANCGLPYYIGEVIADRAALTLQTPERFYDRFRVAAKVRHEVTGIDPAAKRITVRNLETGEEFQDSYDKLVLSPGAKAMRPNIPGIDHERIFTLRTVEDSFRIHDYVKESDAKSALVVGGGFVGLEAAENLRHLGLDVALAEAAPQLLAILDSDMAAPVHTLFRAKGIRLFLGNGIASFEEEDGQVVGVFANGEKVAADLVLLAIGVLPDTSLAAQAGLKTGMKGSILVNDRMESSSPDIYAVGDAVEVMHYVTGDRALISLAGPANKQGRIAADNIAGGASRYKGSQGSSVIKLFDMTAAATGINERQATAAGIQYDKVILTPMSHASYYPGGKVMTMKVLFARANDRILGAQIVGYDGVDKRIDVLATAIRAGMKATALGELELAYAPPYSSAKDPVNMAGFAIENLIRDRVKQFYYEDLAELPRDGSAFFLDVRTPAEYAQGAAAGFVNIPLDALRDRLAELPRDKPIYAMCQSGARSYAACRILSALGYDCYNFAGGYHFFSMVEQERHAQTTSRARSVDE